MTKEESAQNYIESKSPELAALLREAYLKGYEDAIGARDYYCEIEGVKYVDLGLPSGTLWSIPQMDNIEDYYECRKVDFKYARKMKIPTLEQFKELEKHCEIINNRFVSKINGNSIRIRSMETFWLNTQYDECHARYVYINYPQTPFFRFNTCTTDYKCNFFLVLNKYMIDEQ